MKIVNKRIILIVLFVIFICILAIPNNKFAADFNPEDYEPDNPTIDEAGDSLEIAGAILGTIRNIGVILSVVMLTILGLKYMLASPSERADYKKSMFPWVVGVTLLMTSVLIVQIIDTTINQKSASEKNVIISISNPYTTHGQYYVGEKLDYNELRITVEYASGRIETEKPDYFPPETLKITGMNHKKLHKGDKTCTFSFVVKDSGGIILE